MQKKTDIEWIPVEEDLPTRGAGYNRVSDFLWLKLESGAVIEGYYVTDDDEWRDRNSKRIPYDDVIAWADKE